MPEIAGYQLHSIETGHFALDGGAMFGIVPRVLWERHFTPDEKNRIPMHMRCLLLEGHGRLILIDNGVGDKYTDRFASMFAIDDATVNLSSSLRALGYDFSDITDVILTHLHFDHCGGSTVRQGDVLKVAFPNAVFHVQKDHWDWACMPNVREKASFLAENMEPLGESGQLSLIEGNTRLFPGIELICVDGHTKSMQLVKMQDEKRTLLFAADLLPTSAHLLPPWNMAYDLWPMTTIEEKARILEQAVAENWTIFFEHDAQTAIAEVSDSERGPRVDNPRTFAELY